MCLGLSCGSPGEVIGAILRGSYLYGDTVTYTCRSGYTMSTGSQTLRCQADQTWAGIKPTCTSERNQLQQTLNLCGLAQLCSIAVAGVSLCT